MKRLIIGVGGGAGEGKDTFFKILSSMMDCKRFALADRLKSELDEKIKSEYGFSIFDCTAEQKNLARPLLVAYGKEKRQASNGTYWTNLLQEQIKKDKGREAVIITDIRYDFYDKDELYWLKKTMGGWLVFIRGFVEIDGKKSFIPAINNDESENNPKLMVKSDYIIEWPRLNLTGEELNSKLSGYVKTFLKKFRSDMGEDR